MPLLSALASKCCYKIVAIDTEGIGSILIVWSLGIIRCRQVVLKVQASHLSIFAVHFGRLSIRDEIAHIEIGRLERLLICSHVGKSPSEHDRHSLRSQSEGASRAINSSISNADNDCVTAVHLNGRVGLNSLAVENDWA